ncbi:esterase/lipase family protein [Frigoribacterium sp. 2-23]|uniref:esterase/lipase family protein n=1 Tax=Frigoribacterium sp. 2-23 TaxID=3415006 RepID=UPI003C6FCC2F
MTPPSPTDGSTRPDPRRRRPPLPRLVGILVRDYAYVWRTNLLTGSRRALPRRYRQGDRAPVLVLPGVYETWQFLKPIADRLNEAGHPVVVVPGLGRNRRPIAATAQLAQAILDRNRLTDVIVLAHSKGGLIGKTMMTSTDVDHRIERMVAINSPFSGSRWALLMPTRTLRVFSPRDAALTALAANLEINSSITSLFSGYDLHVTEGSVLPGATNVELPVDGHFRPLGDATCIEIAIAAVEGGPGAAEARRASLAG